MALVDFANSSTYSSVSLYRVTRASIRLRGCYLLNVGGHSSITPLIKVEGIFIIPLDDKDITYPAYLGRRVLWLDISRVVTAYGYIQH